MSPVRSPEGLHRLALELLAMPRETAWLEFKHNNGNPEEIGEYISALANSAALSDKPYGYVLWGVEDGTNALVGTTFAPHAEKKGNEGLENWLHRGLQPPTHFEFFEIPVDNKRVVVLEVERAQRQPVQFRGDEYIRLSSHKKRLKDLPEKERLLWRTFDRVAFEGGIALEDVDAETLTERLDHAGYFSLTKQRVPESRSGIVDALVREKAVQRTSGGLWNITNLGALLFAKRLEDFPTLSRKAMRVIVYEGTSRIRTKREQVGSRGYATGFEGLIEFVRALVPANEEIAKALRTSVPMYPELAIRELVANALIHQDFSTTGVGPMIEIFDDRIEITNPGTPLLDVDRFLDNPPCSRNETLAALMRRMGICEERGSGIDKVVFELEFYQLPAPLFQVLGESTRAVLFAPRPLAKMDREDRVRACYLHACLRYVSQEYLTNASLRQRFGIGAQNSATASRLIKEAIEAGKITPENDGVNRKLMRYVPHWALARESPE
ncbi:MAG: ATP-binding protein [Polyangiaceae bacterium]|nr:ATP-binding protein [Polyangiaceae bacterium]